MTIANINAIWGSPLFEPRIDARVDLEPEFSSLPIERQLRTFLRERINRFRPDLVIVVERKGTAARITRSGTA